MYKLFYRIYESKKWQKFNWFRQVALKNSTILWIYSKSGLKKQKETEINDPNAVALGTSENNKSSVRMVLLKGLSNEGFVFYTNFNSKKGRDLNKNRFASMCFHWKSLRRQVRVFGEVKKVTEKEADEYYNSRAYGSRISAWASSQSEPMKSRDIFLNKIEEFKKKYPEEKKCSQAS